MAELTLREAKARAINKLRAKVPQMRQVLAEYDERLALYYEDLCEHSSADDNDENDHHNLYELLAAIKLLRLMDKYVHDVAKAQMVIKLREGQWHKEGNMWLHDTGGLLLPGSRGNTYYRWMNFQVFVYSIAPTGIGKTMATLFPALKALKDKDKLFFITAKGSGKNAPLEAIELLSKNGLKIKAIDITAKRKICNCGKKNCNPDDCPFAIGYFSRLKAATYEIYKSYDIFTKEVILEIANKYSICAFEFSLYLSYFCSFVTADYNYVFDPKAHLIRYFDDDTYKPKVLVDEAHNLVSRSKDMYSATILENDIRSLRKNLSSYKPSARSLCNKAIEIFDKYHDILAEKALYVSEDMDIELNKIL